jgi:hypothetical protein
MTTGSDVLTMLIPDGGWVMYGEDFDGIRFIEATPITEEEFKAGFAKYDAWKIKQDAAKEKSRQEILDRLGITADEAALILG